MPLMSAIMSRTSSPGMMVPASYCRTASADTPIISAQRSWVRPEACLAFR